MSIFNFASNNLIFSRKAFDDGGGQEEDFSDDESERRHFQKQRAKNRGPSQSSRWEACKLFDLSDSILLNI